MPNKTAEEIKDTIDNLFVGSATVKPLIKDDTGARKAIVITGNDCSSKVTIVFNYTSEKAIEPEVTREVARLTKEGVCGIRVVKGIELEYPFKIA